MENEEAALEQLTSLVSNHPEISQDVVTDILSHCNQNVKQAVNILSDMFQLEQIQNRPSLRPDKEASSTPKSSSSSKNTSFISSQGPTPVNPTPPRGAWAKKTYAHSFRVDKLCNRYQWAQRDIIENLFEAYGGCEQLVEDQLVTMFPIDEPIAFADHPNDKTNKSNRVDYRRQQQSQAMRIRVENELRLEASKGGPAPLSSEELIAHRQALWDTREYRQRLQILACQTRKPEHFIAVKEQDEKLHQLSQNYLQALRRSDDFRNGCLDVHGLTKEEAIQLVEWKLGETGNKRFRVITGRGTHSHLGQAVLKPALEKYLGLKGISCSHFEDGILTIAP